jgi:hypothetical protein
MPEVVLITGAGRSIAAYSTGSMLTVAGGL